MMYMCICAFKRCGRNYLLGEHVGLAEGVERDVGRVVGPEEAAEVVRVRAQGSAHGAKEAAAVHRVVVHDQLLYLQNNKKGKYYQGNRQKSIFV